MQRNEGRKTGALLGDKLDEDLENDGKDGCEEQVKDVERIEGGLQSPFEKEEVGGYKVKRAE